MTEPAVERDLAERIGEIAKQYSGLDPKDIVEVVESVMASVSGDLSTVNLKLYAEIESLARFIDTAKREIASLSPEEITDEHLATGTGELQEIVGATEQATHTIFEAVEKIESLSEKIEPEISAQIGDAVTSVYEACSFQDITGQRITKVVNALQHIEVKIEDLLNAFGDEFSKTPRLSKKDKPKFADGRAERPDEHLMNGPQLSGSTEAMSQDDIDALLGFD